MSDEGDSLSSMLSLNESRAPKAEPKVEVKVEPKVEAKAEPEIKSPAKAEPELKAEVKDESKDRDEKGRFAPKEKEKVKPDVAAIIDERRKRQAAEERLKQLETQAPKTDVFSDPDKAIAERVDAAIRPLTERFFQMSLKAAKAAHSDYEEVVTAFNEAAESDPRLIESLRNASDPGEYAYSVGLQIRELADVDGDIVKYRDKVAGEYKGKLSDAEKLIAALKAENATLKGQKAELDEVPDSLNSVSSGPSPKSSEVDDEPLNKLTRFGNQKRA